MKYLMLVWAGLWRKPARIVLTSLSERATGRDGPIGDDAK